MLGEGQKRTIAYVRRADIKKNVADIDFDKVFIAAAGGSGNDPNILAVPIVAPKKSPTFRPTVRALAIAMKSHRNS